MKKSQQETLTSSMIKMGKVYFNMVKPVHDELLWYTDKTKQTHETPVIYC